LRLSRLGAIVAATAEEGQVTAGFEATLAVTVLEIGGALETSEILLLELVGGEEDTLAFSLLFLLVTRVKAISSTSGASTIISISGDGVGIGLGPQTVLIASTRVEALG